MNVSENFLGTLKRLRFPLANECKSSDFESVFSDELKPIISAVCNLNEDNVLSTEELQEYSSLSYEELSHLTDLAQGEDLLPPKESEEEKKMELSFLEEQLALIEEHNNTLQKQKDTLKTHQSRLLDERNNLETILVDSKRRFNTYAVRTVPEAEDELVALLQSISELSCNLQSLIVESDYISEIIPSSKVKDIENYFEEERQLVLYIKEFLQKHFEVRDNYKDFKLNVPGYSESELLRQVHILKKVLKESKMAEFVTAIEDKKSDKIVELLRRHQGGNVRDVFEISTFQLRSKLDMEIELHERLTKKEEALKLHLHHSVEEHVDAQCSEIGYARSEEIIKAFNLSLEKLQVPLDHLIKQRSRLELLLFYLNSSSQKFKSLRLLVDYASSYIEKEQEALKKRKIFYEEEMAKDVPQDSTYLSENSIFLSVYKMLTDIEHQHMSFISMKDILSKMDQLHMERKALETEQDEKLHVLTLLEKQRSQIEKFIVQGKEFSRLCEMDSEFNVKLNKLDMKITTLQKTVADKSAYVNQNKKLLARNRYRRLGRELYVHALLDEEYFHQLISNVKRDANNTANLDSS